MQNYMDLTGKVAIITGAASGIGYSTVQALANCGAAVAINFHKNETGAELLRKANRRQRWKSSHYQGRCDLCERRRLTHAQGI
jgi:NAD(P)-dependent dehydrogenase (short-subunit alcohol dehydrogenase family)